MRGVRGFSRAGLRRFTPAVALPLICLVLAVPAAVGARVAGSPGERLVEPVAGEFHFAGRGFGHGHGMSQWGAQGAAVHGIDHRTILAAYYPGTRLVRESAIPPVRVLLSAVGGDGLRLAAGPGMRIVSGGTTRPLPRRLDELEVTDWRISSTDEGLLLAALTDRWQRYLAPDTDGGPVEVRNASAGVLQIVSPRARHEYRGALRVYPGERPGQVRVVNVVDMQSYLRSVVPAESPAGWAPEALEAQAVAARTFARWHAAHASAGAVWDLCDTTACQVYRGYRSLRPNGGVDQQFEFPRSDQAVAASPTVRSMLYQGQARVDRVLRLQRRLGERGRRTRICRAVGIPGTGWRPSPFPSLGATPSPAARIHAGTGPGSVDRPDWPPTVATGRAPGAAASSRCASSAKAARWSSTGRASPARWECGTRGGSCRPTPPRRHPIGRRTCHRLRSVPRLLPAPPPPAPARRPPRNPSLAGRSLRPNLSYDLTAHGAHPQPTVPEPRPRCWPRRARRRRRRHNRCRRNGRPPRPAHRRADRSRQQQVPDGMSSSARLRDRRPRRIRRPTSRRDRPRPGSRSRRRPAGP